MGIITASVQRSHYMFNHLNFIIMKQRIKEFCDKYIWFIFPIFSAIAIMISVVLEKNFPLCEIISKIM